MTAWPRLLCLCFVGVFYPAMSYAATSIPFTVNLSRVVNVTGTPRLVMDVGGTTRYATYTSGTGTAALTFTYTIQSGDVDLNGVDLISPIDLNGGTITDIVGNPANLTFVPPNTSGVYVDAAVPNGYSIAFADDTVTNINKTNLSFSLTYPKANKTLHYSITSSGGGTPITGTITTLAGTTTVTGINATTFPDGLLTLSGYLTDTIGGTGVTVTDTAPMAVLDGSLVGYWTFDANDILGTTAYDRSGQGNNGTLTNGPTQTTGKVGGGLTLDGVNDFVQIGTNFARPSNISIVVWVKTTSAFGQGVFGQSDVQNPAAASSYIPALGVRADGKIRAELWTGAVGSVLTAGPYNDGNWHLVCVVGSTTNQALYVDGGLVGNRAGTLNQVWWNVSQIGAAYDPSGANRINGNNGWDYTQGNIDNVRVYNRSLTPAEITTIYNAEH